MGIEPIGPFLRGCNQRCDLVSHLIKHLAEGPVDIGRGDQYNLPIGATFPVLDGKETCRLPVPQLELI